MHVYNQKTDIKPNNLKVFGDKLIKEHEEDRKNRLKLKLCKREIDLSFIKLHKLGNHNIKHIRTKHKIDST